MTTYAQSLTATIGYTTTPGSAILDIKAPSTSAPRLLEISGYQTASQGSPNVGLGRATTELFQLDPRKFYTEELLSGEIQASETSLATVWTVAPVVPVQFFRRISPTQLTGAGWIMTFPRGLPFGASTSLVLWSNAFNAANAWVLSAEIDE